MMPKTQMTSALAAFLPAEPGQAAERETALDRWRRRALGAAWALKHGGIGALPGLTATLASHLLTPQARRSALPDPGKALARPDGLAGICSDMGAENLLAAYRAGLFPFCHVEPMKWWAPSARMVLFIEDFRMEKNLRRRLRNRHFRVTFDHDFDAVIRACAQARPGRRHLTWITPRVIAAYRALHEQGHAHSVEVWDKDGALAGGCYGLAIGRVFFTESQFVRARDASKVGFATLNRHLQAWGYVLNDGKHPNGHLAHVGFKLVPRAEFNAILAKQCGLPGQTGTWHVDDRLDVGGWDPRAALAERA